MAESKSDCLHATGSASAAKRNGSVCHLIGLYRSLILFGLALVLIYGVHVRWSNKILLTRNLDPDFKYPTCDGEGAEEDSNIHFCKLLQCVRARLNMDLATSPCDNFYQFACGGWSRRNIALLALLEGLTSYGKMTVENHLALRTALGKQENVFLDGVGIMKAKRYYKSCLSKNASQDQDDAFGSRGIVDFLSRIGGWALLNQSNTSSPRPFQAQLELLHNQYGMTGLFDWTVERPQLLEAGKSRPKLQVIQLRQGELTIPDRDVYLNSSNQAVMDKYLDGMTRVVVLLGRKDDEVTVAQLKAIIEFEISIANITIIPGPTFDRDRLFHSFTITELQRFAPMINWSEYFNSALDLIHTNITEQDEIFVDVPMYFSNLSSLVASKLATDEGRLILNNYLIWNTVVSLGKFGAVDAPSVWDYWDVSCIKRVGEHMRYAIDAIFMQERLNSGSNPAPAVRLMAEQIRTSFKSNLASVDWMDSETRQIAADKIQAITDLIGQPPFVFDQLELAKEYENLRIDENDYCGNVVRARQFTLRKKLERFRTEVNLSRWDITTWNTAMVNAQYLPTGNAIIIPAGILKYPIFDRFAPNSINYGAAGFVIGHEISHSLDHTCQEYDKFGTRIQQWSDEAITRFKGQSSCLVEQYSSYKANNSVINGSLWLDEAMADNGGLKAAFHAYNRLDPSDLEPSACHDLTHDQLFFLGFAQTFCSTGTLEKLYLEKQDDVHAPRPLRVHLTLANFPEFAKAYSCPVGSAMNPEKTCKFW